MTFDLLLAFLAFAVVAAVTPGPNNLIVLAAGTNFGFVRSVPTVLGMACGVVVMFAAIGAGLGGIFGAYPILYDVLRWVGAAYLLYLAWGIARGGAPKTSDGGGPADRPLGFLGAAAFQWVNPKAWITVLGAVATYVPREGYFLNVLLVAVVFGLVAIPCLGIWTGFGTALKSFLGNPTRVRVFNVAMALLLVLSFYPILAENLPG